MGPVQIAALVPALFIFLLPFAVVSTDEQGDLAQPHRKLRLARRGRELGLLQAGAEPRQLVPKAVQEPAAAVAATQYFGVIQVGSPVQEFRVVFDSASGQLILPSTKCGDAACEKHRRFHAENSTSAKQIGWADDATAAISDDDDRDTKTLSLFGSDVSGEFVRDRICFGGEGQLCGTADFVVLTEEADEPFGQLGFDGVLGLAPSSPDSPEFNVLHALLKGKAPGAAVFSFYLAPGMGGGELVFGGYRPELLANGEPPTWAPVTGNGSWHVLVEDVTVNGKAASLCGKAGCLAAVDTGASLLMSPGNMLWALMGKLGVDDECSGSPATLGFIVAGKNFELDSADYLERDADGCRLLMASLSDIGKGSASLVLGYPFLRKYYTIFDYAQNRVGFARARAPLGGPAASPPAGAVAVPLVGVRP